jgi:hypothetical protein
LTRDRKNALKIDSKRQSSAALENEMGGIRNALSYRMVAFCISGGVSPRRSDVRPGAGN